MAEQDGRWFEVRSSRFFERRIAHVSRVTRHSLAGCGKTQFIHKTPMNFPWARYQSNRRMLKNAVQQGRSE